MQIVRASLEFAQDGTFVLARLGSRVSTLLSSGICLRRPRIRSNIAAAESETRRQDLRYRAHWVPGDQMVLPDDIERKATCFPSEA